MIAILIAATFPTLPDIVQYSFPLSGCQENPQHIVTGHGTATATLDTETGVIDVNGSYEGLTSECLGVHIHAPAKPGENGALIVVLEHTGNTSGTIRGTGFLSEFNVDNVLSGLAYVNVHTELFYQGEIRGQIVHDCPGDFNQDGSRDILDFVSFQSAFLAEACESDVNHDLAYDILDFVAFQDAFLDRCD